MRFKRKNVLPTVILLLSLIIIVTLIVLNNKKRKSVFDNEYTFKIATVEKLKEKASKGKTTRKDLIYFFFTHNDTVFHKIFHTGPGVISSLNIQVGDNYMLKVGLNETDIFELDLKNKIDTVLFFDKFLPHVYKSERHKEIVKKNN